MFRFTSQIGVTNKGVNKEMTINKKLWTGFGVAALAMAIVGGIGYFEVSRTAQGITALLGIMLTIGMGLYISWSITHGIMEKALALNDMSEQFASASEQVNSSSQQLAEGASQQAASDEETSSSLEEMSSMTKQNANNAQQADTLSVETKTTTESCSNTMQEMAAAIGEVNESSQETQKIVKTIDEIAFQTNLLALNAAVEAARAGEAGSGFAVVADEVRNLALRAAEAAKNTSTQIEDIGKKINDAMEMVLKSIDEFSKVDENTGKVKELIGEIAAASGEQAQGIEQVNLAVSDMDKIVQQNAANSEESASASEELSAHAGQLKTLVNALSVLVGGSTNGKGTDQDSKCHQVRKIPEENRSMQKRPKHNTGNVPQIPMGDNNFKGF